MIYNQGPARRWLLNQPSTNPSIAAKSLLKDRRVVKYATRRMTRRSAHRGNPPIALVMSLIPKLAGLLKKPSEQRAAAVVQQIVNAANAGNLTAAKGLIDRAAIPMKVAESNIWKAAVAQLAPSTIQAARLNAGRIPPANQKNPEEFANSVLASPIMAEATALPGGAAAAAGPTAAQIAAGFAVPVVRELSKPARRSSARQRYPTYVDRQGKQRYSTKPPGTDLRIPAGATPTAGSPYSFFRGAVGKGGAAATAGQVAVAAAAGLAAYLVTQRLLQHLGGGAQRKEEAGVNAALAFRQARADFKAQQGRDPNQAELREMSDAYKAQLLELGYDPVTFTRTRSGLDKFFETYNPLGG